ncbi:MAG: hypothetical protein Q9183_006266 [Haloplaca sp. 2 TL-2023]
MAMRRLRLSLRLTNFTGKNLADYSDDKEGFCTDLIAANQNGWSSNEFIILPKSQTASPINCLSDQYDEDSIMHYSGGSGGPKKDIIGIEFGHRKTVLGQKGKPNESFKKNTKPSVMDVARVNDMYAEGQICDPESGSEGGSSGDGGDGAAAAAAEEAGDGEGDEEEEEEEEEEDD